MDVLHYDNDNIPEFDNVVDKKNIYVLAIFFVSISIGLLAVFPS